MPDASYSFQQIAQTETPGAIRLRVRNAAATGALPLDFTVLSNQSWLTVAPASGSLASNQTAELWVSANTTGLVSGTYVGTLTISDPDALNNPYDIEFTLQIDACAETFQVTLTACTSTVTGVVTPCTSTLNVVVEPCSSTMTIVEAPCTATINAVVSTTCTSSIVAAVSCPDIAVVDS